MAVKNRRHRKKERLPDPKAVNFIRRPTPTLYTTGRSNESRRDARGGSGEGEERTVGTYGAHRLAVPARRSIIEVLRVSGTSRPNSVAGAIAALLRSEGEVEVQAIGPHAVNQAVKAIAIARSYIESEGIDLNTVPSFVKLELQNEERTAVRFAVVRLQKQQ